MSGVEENENSRFVDYTLASPFETLCFEIERVFKLWHRDGFSVNGGRSIIKYESNRYILSGYDDNGAAYRESLGRNLCAQELKHCFNVMKYVILTTDGNWVNVTQSTRQTLFSALLIALQSANIPSFPVFIANVDISKINIPLRHILGYGVRHKNGVLVTTMFESHSMANIHAQHELYFLDGIAKLFESKYFQFTHHHEKFSQMNAVCQISEEFRYVSYGQQIVSRAPPPYQLNNPLLYAAMVDRVYWKDLQSLWMAFPDYYPVNSSLSELIITLKFLGITPGSFVDNSLYTTFLPSKLACHNWCLSSVFKPLTNVAIKKNIIEGQLYSTSSTLASGLRRLISFYIYSHICCPLMTTMVDLKKLNKSSSNRIPHSEKALALTMKLSDQTKLMMEEMCTKINRNVHVPNRIRFIPFMFDLSTNAEEAGHNSDNNKRNSKNKTKQSKQYFAVTEMFSLFTAGLSVDMQSVSEMWTKFIEELNDNNQMLTFITRHIVPLDCSTVLNVSDKTNNDAPIHSDNRTKPKTDVNQKVDSNKSSMKSKDSQNYLHLNLSTGISGLDDTDIGQDETRNHVNSTLCTNLWANLFAKYHAETNVSLKLPDPAQSIIVQRLEYFNICCVAQRERVYYETPLTTVDNDPNVSVINFHLPKLQLRPPVLWDPNSPTDVIPIIEESVDNILNLCSTIHTAAGRGVDLGKSVELALVISDIQAFKAVNNWSKENHQQFEIFFEWYQSKVFAHIEVSHAAKIYDSLQLIWENTAPISIYDQKQIYNWQDESTKNLQKLESIPPSVLSLHLMTASLPLFYTMIRNEMSEWLPKGLMDVAMNLPSIALDRTPFSATTKSMTSDDNHSNADSDNGSDENMDDEDYHLDDLPIDSNNEEPAYYLSKKLQHLKMKIMQSVSILQQKLHQNFLNSDRRASVKRIHDSIDILHKLDSIAKTFECLEEYIIRSHELESLFNFAENSQLIHQIVYKSNNIVLNNDGDASAVFDFVKRVSHKHGNTWESIDGRELGLPHKKSFEISCTVGIHGNNSSSGYDSKFKAYDVHHNLQCDIENEALILSSTFEELDL